MWEKLLELALFVRSNGTHRKPTEILKSFIKKPEIPAKLKNKERAALTRAFTFLRTAYKQSPRLGSSRLATDQTHFYTLATSLLSSGLLDAYQENDLIAKLTNFAILVDKSYDPTKPISDKPLDQAIAKYMALSTEKTTDATRRKDRQVELVKALGLL